MTIIRLKIPLESREYEALLEASLIELRNPVDQARFILRAELERRGLLDPQMADKLSHVDGVGHAQPSGR